MNGYIILFSQQQGLSKGLTDAGITDTLPLVTLHSRTDGVRNMTLMIYCAYVLRVDGDA